MPIVKSKILRRLTDAINPYRWVMAVRNRAFDTGVLKSQGFDIPTICVGNISVGGTGKTPHIEYIVRLLKEHYKVAVLSRGYGRKSKGYIKADTTTTMEQIGDEPFQIKNKFNGIEVAVCEKRAVGIERLRAENNGLQAILLDDAYQHRYVKAGLNILLIDSNRPVWNDCVMPFGRLRESINGIKRADIAIVTKCNGLTDEQKAEYRRYIIEKKEMPVYFSAVRYGKPYPLFKSATTGIVAVSVCPILLITGIAKPQPMKAELERQGARVDLMRYADHHNFSVAELNDIAERFSTGGYAMILTTEKDATRIMQHKELPQIIRDNIYALPIEVEILDGEERMFNNNIYNYVTENSRNS